MPQRGLHPTDARREERPEENGDDSKLVRFGPERPCYRAWLWWRRPGARDSGRQGKGRGSCGSRLASGGEPVQPGARRVQRTRQSGRLERPCMFGGCKDVRGSGVRAKGGEPTGGDLQRGARVPKVRGRQGREDTFPASARRGLEEQLLPCAAGSLSIQDGQ